MSPNDSSSDLDSRISAIVESTVGKLRDELVHRLQDTESRLRKITDRLGDVVTPEPLPEPAPQAAAAAPAAAVATADADADLFAAVVAIDRGGSQQEVLAALLEGIGGFANRSALFLTRANAARGWGSYGFEETARAIQETVLSYGEGPLAALAEGHGCVSLTADECATLCGQMGAAAGAEGLLVPFVLRDRLAAALYVDRFADDPPLSRRSLQLLTYVAALAVEGLALRERAETPTLQIATDEAEAAPGVALWEAPGTEPAPTSVEPSAAQPTAPPPAATTPPPPEPPPPPAEPPLPTEADLSETRLSEPDLGALDLGALAGVPAAPPAVEEAPAEAPSEALPRMTPDLESLADEEWEMPAAAAEEPPAPLESLAEPAPAPAPPVEEPLAAEPAVETPPWEAATDSEMPVTEPVPAEEAAILPPAAEEPGGTGGGSTQVSPPTDVTGPGWAFTASRAAAESGDEAQHEEARRLARLLVTEIKLYNEEQVEEGRRGNDIYARLREDIDRSRLIFNERVDEAVREEADYFHEEMVRILAGGNAEALGL